MLADQDSFDLIGNWDLLVLLYFLPRCLFASRTLGHHRYVTPVSGQSSSELNGLRYRNEKSKTKSEPNLISKSKSLRLVDWFRKMTTYVP